MSNDNTRPISEALLSPRILSKVNKDTVYVVISDKKDERVTVYADITKATINLNRLKNTSYLEDPGIVEAMNRIKVHCEEIRYYRAELFECQIN
jgi:hypothetical protein